MIGIEVARHGVMLAQVVAWAGFSAASFTTLSGMVEGFRPGTLTQVWAWVVRALSVAYSLICQAADLLGDLLVSYVWGESHGRHAVRPGEPAYARDSLGRVVMVA